MKTLIVMAFLLILGSNSFAGGKKPPVIDPTIPNPYRAVILTEVGTKTFQLPGGSPVNFSADFQTILNTATTNSNAFLPSDPNWLQPCGQHLEIRSSVSSFQLNVIQAGIKFGYNPLGGIGPVPGLKGKFMVTVGEMSFDASVWECKGGSCLSIAAATANQTTVGTDLEFEVDFDQINLGISLITNPALGTITRALMTNTLVLLGQNPQVVKLPWQALVRHADNQLGLFIFDAGSAFNIKINQTFEIYEPNDSSPIGICDVFKVIAEAHTTQVNTISSIALVDKTMNGGTLAPGDVVMTRSSRPGEKPHLNGSSRF